tara:strand:+ start:71 stop:751 length:681 start_codon:yes stop_codon:yes gene_type:complete
MTDVVRIYSLPLGETLRVDWVPLHHDKLLESRLLRKMNPEAGWFWFRLMMASMRQDPAGTLPDDDVELADMAGLGGTPRRWTAMRGRGALAGWEPVLCLPQDPEADPAEGQVRLGNRDVEDVVQNTLKTIRQSRERNKRAGERSRWSRLKSIMRDQCGAHAGLTERDDFVQAVRDRLAARKDQWSAPNVRAAMDHVSTVVDGRASNDRAELARVADIMRNRRPTPS